MTSQPAPGGRSASLQSAYDEATDTVAELMAQLEAVAAALGAWHDKHFIFTADFHGAQLAVDTAWRAAKLALQYLTD